MKILVCVNHVPDTEAKIKPGADGLSIDPTGVNFMLSPYDEYAIEEGLKLREKFTGEVVAISLGPDANREALRKALAMGCDKAVLLKDGSVRDSFGVASGLAEYAKEYGPDIVLCGKQSIDFDDGAVGGMLAEFLGMSSISVVVKLDVVDRLVTAEREIEGGREVVSARLPAVISAQKGLNTPRYPSLKGIMDAKRKPIEERTAAPSVVKTEIIALRKPAAKNPGRIVESVAALAQALHIEAKVI
ncbi:MAG: electron transfer flavoprotein subunit beta/FixA family protein [Ignavibacteriales bacterium]|nr:electron transfer flavoprotein subunit beta/FixA family protein [Ignavibacteriales bacterium]